jgi:hypothetical protein
MNDPKRLLAQDSDRVTRLLLAAGRAESPGRPRLARIATAAAGAGATLSAKAAASTAVVAASPVVGGSVTSLVVLKWIGLGALGGLMLSATASQIQPRSSATQSPPAGASPQAAPFSGVRHEASKPAPTSAWARYGEPEPPPREPDPGAEKAPLAPVSEAKVAVHRPSARSTPVSDLARIPSEGSAQRPGANDAPADLAQSDSHESLAARALREEVEALARAKSALNRGAGPAALEAVRAYRVHYPKGRLAPEATYIEMEAALLAGDRARAEQIAQRLASGTTPSAKRAREILKGR